MLLKNKVAVITGGAGLNGLGFSTARLMAAQGARVVILDLERAEPSTAAARLGEGHLGLVADVTDKASCEAAAQVVLQQFGRIDILVNNAGITQPARFLDISGKDYDRILDVSLRGTLYMSQAVLPAMRAQQSGSIVCISSVSASAVAVFWAVRTIRRPRPGYWGWRAPWRASSDRKASASIASRQVSSRPTSTRTS